jgi:hypothetical protein
MLSESHGENEAEDEEHRAWFKGMFDGKSLVTISQAVAKPLRRFGRLSAWITSS